MIKTTMLILGVCVCAGPFCGQLWVAGCLSSDKTHVSSANARNGRSRHELRYTVHHLNPEDSLEGKKSNLRAHQGDFIYATLTVPWSDQHHDWLLTVKASWTQKHYSTPLWLYIKKAGLPTTSDFDKASISFVTEKYARIRMESASPGLYYVMMEALTELRDVTLSVSIEARNEDQEDDSRMKHYRFKAIP